MLVLGGIGALLLPGLRTEPAQAAASAPSKAPRKSRLANAAPVATAKEAGQNPIAAHLGPAGAPVSVTRTVRYPIRFTAN